MASTIRTRIPILSDTHGKRFPADATPLHHADVAIHCGDLTDGSQLSEFHATLQMLRALDAPLKLVIAGNHDFTMDVPAFDRKVAEAETPLKPEDVARAYGKPGEVRLLFEEARDEGIIFLDEGTHHFSLENEAILTVYASPYTPALGAWGFQYHPDEGHDFAIEEGTDIAMTHGPPRGVMDYTHGRERAGCPDLFAAVAKARPKVHCFGHIHEGWGARLVTWKDEAGERLTHFNAINNEKSVTIARLTRLKPTAYDTFEEVEQKSRMLEGHQRARSFTTSHCRGDEYPLEHGRQTLFVNASVCDSGGEPVQLPWIVDLELPRARQGVVL